MQKTALDDRIRNAKPDYIQLDKDKLTAVITEATDIQQPKRKSRWTKKRVIASIVIPLAALSAVGFTKLPNFWVDNGSVRAYTGPSTPQMELNGIKSMGGFYAKNGPFRQAKHAISLPNDEIVHVQKLSGAMSGISLNTREVIIMGVPFIRDDLLQKDNYAFPNANLTSDNEYFIPAKHAITLPENEIARSDKDQNANTKEILIQGKQPLIRWDVISPDNNANY